MQKALVVAALSLGACTTTPSMESALAPLAGQPVAVVFDQLGTPSSSTPYGAGTVYEWHHAKTVHGTPSSRFLGSASAPSEDAPTPGLFPGPPVPYTCDVRILAGADGRIKDAQFSEQTGGCRDSAKKLNQLVLADSR